MGTMCSLKNLNFGLGAEHIFEKFHSIKGGSLPLWNLSQVLPLLDVESFPYQPIKIGKDSKGVTLSILQS